MAAGKIRNSIEDSKRIPFDRPIWFMLVHIDKNGHLQNEAFQATKNDLINISGYIKHLIQKHIVFKVFGVWTGSWNTDLFEMDIDVFTQRLKDYGYWDYTRRTVK